MDKKYLVVYSSLTGNTKKVGEAVAEALGTEDTVLEPVENNPDYEGYDLVAVGYWVDKGDANIKAKKYIESIKNARVALFITLGATPESEHGRQCLAKGVKLLDASNQLLGTFICQGKIDPKVLEVMMKYIHAKGMPRTFEEKIRAMYGEAGTHPDENDLRAAQQVFKAIKAKLTEEQK